MYIVFLYKISKYQNIHSVRDYHLLGLQFAKKKRNNSIDFQNVGNCQNVRENR